MGTFFVENIFRRHDGGGVAPESSNPNRKGDVLITRSNIYASSTALFSAELLMRLRAILRSEAPEIEITSNTLIAAAIKITQFVALQELQKENKS